MIDLKHFPGLGRTAIFLLLLLTSISPAAGRVVKSLGNPTLLHSYLLDSDENDGNDLSNRHTAETTFEAEIRLISGTPSHNGNYRLAYQFKKEDGTAIKLVNGLAPSLGTAYTDSQSVSLSTPGNTLQTLTFAALPDPAATLGSKTKYFVEGTLQEEISRGVWEDVVLFNVVARTSTAPTQFLHFTNTVSGDPEYNVRAGISELTWNRTHALATDPATDSFTATAEIFSTRWDDFNSRSGSNLISFKADFDLIAVSSGQSMALENDGINEFQLTAANHTPGISPQPVTLPLTTINAEIKPLVQLASAGETYVLRCTITHIEDIANAVFTDTACDLDDRTLLHFNGTLHFGPLATTFDGLGNIPFVLPGSTPTFIDTEISVPPDQGLIPNRPGYAFGNNDLLPVHLLDNGDAVLQTLKQTAYVAGDPTAPVGCDFGGIELVYNSITLDTAGARANTVSVPFPQGLSLINDETINPFMGTSQTTQPGATALDSSLCPAGPIVIPLGANARLADESHPVTFKVSSLTVSSIGLSFDSTEAKYIHDQAYDALEFLRDDGQITAEMADRASNDRHLKGISLAVNTIEITIAEDGTSRLNTTLEAQPTEFQSHFPSSTTVDIQSPSIVTFEDGEMSSGDAFNDVASVTVDYYQTCKSDICTAGFDPVPVTQVPFGGELYPVPGGGLHGAGDIVSGGELVWGVRGPDQYAHRTNEFADGSFYMPGYQLYAAGNVLIPNVPLVEGGADLAPATLLLSGFNNNIFAPDLHLYSESGYTTGDGDLPGLNFTVFSSGFGGASQLGGSGVDYEYDLLPDGAKYYIRLSGVSGRQVAQDGTLDESVLIHGFPTEFVQFQLSFLDSDNSVFGTASWADGRIQTIGPYSEWEQDFTGMRFDCLGEPGGMKVDLSNANGKMLSYWNSTFDLKSLKFVKTELNPGSCPKQYEAKLVAGAKTRVAYISKDLYGVMAFTPDGNLSTEANKIEEFNSQFGIPANVPLQGPNKDYNLTTVSKLRFNNPTVPGAPATGFVTFAATLDIPYFVDLQVQAITSATPGNIASFYLVPGWTELPDETTFFNNALFDSEHRGFPTSGIGFDEYREPTPDTDGKFLITAEQKLFNLVDLKYPLRWDFTTRRFSSMKTQKQELLVTQVEHQVEWMDAKFANISFGAKYDGIPQLKLSNYLNNEIDQVADIIASQFSALAQQAIDEALAGMERMLEDSLEAVIDPMIDAAAAENGPIEGIHTAIIGAADNQNQYMDFRAKVQKTLTEQDNILDILYRNNVLTPLLIELRKGGAAANEVQSFVVQLDDALQDVVKGIDAIIQGVQIVDGQAVYLEILPSDAQIAFSPSFETGLLFKNGDARNIVANVIDALLRNYLEPEVRAVIVPLLADGTDLSKELNSLLSDLDPTFDQIRLILLEVRKTVVEIQQSIAGATGVAGQISDIIADAEAGVNAGEFGAIIEMVGQKAWARFQQLEATLGIDPASVAEADISLLTNNLTASKAEFVALLKDELKSGILASDFVQELQFMFRQTLYDVQDRITSAFQSVLNQFSEVLKEVVGEAVGKLEEEINPLLGKVSKYMGSGEITGYAEINGDSLRKLRLDAMMQFEIPEEMSLHVYLEILSYSSEDNFVESGCIEPGEKVVEVRIGAQDVAIDWISDIKIDLEVKMSLSDAPDDGFDFPVPNGVGGKFEMTDGVLEFQSFEVIEFGATIAVGFDETYIGAKARAVFSSYEVAAAIFFGRTCTLEPLLFVDPDIGDVVTAGTTFTGAYVYGEVWLPISELVLGVPASCLFRIDAGVGAGAFYFVEGPTYGGKMFLGVSGEALCLVSIRGEVKMILASQAGNVRGSGKGKFTAKIGWCPFCIKFRKSVKIKYNNGGWGID